MILIDYLELNELAMEAVQNDGRLARRPLRICSKEIEAHKILLSHITQLIEEYNVSLEVNFFFFFWNNFTRGNFPCHFLHQQLKGFSFHLELQWLLLEFMSHQDSLVLRLFSVTSFPISSLLKFGRLGFLFLLLLSSCYRLQKHLIVVTWRKKLFSLTFSF